jgi:propanediol dehydratase small subunit
MTVSNVEKKVASNAVMKRYEKLVQPHLKEIQKQKARGVPESDIARKYGIGARTWSRWKECIKELYDALETAKVMHTEKLVAKATQAASGYYVTETIETFNRDGVLVKSEKKRKFIKPDNLLLMFLIKHQDPEHYGDITVEGNTDVQITFVPAKKKNKKEEK